MLKGFQVVVIWSFKVLTVINYATFNKKLLYYSLVIKHLQYGPKIMHAQEVLLKLHCALSARSSKRKESKILSARRCKGLRVLPQTANTPYSSWLNQQWISSRLVYKPHLFLKVLAQNSRVRLIHETIPFWKSKLPCYHKLN